MTVPWGWVDCFTRQINEPGTQLPPKDYNFCTVYSKWNEGMQDPNSTVELPGNEEYKGGWVNGWRDGYGLVSIGKKVTFLGWWKKGRRHG
jgi:hypothetical protein